MTRLSTERSGERAESERRDWWQGGERELAAAPPRHTAAIWTREMTPWHRPMAMHLAGCDGDDGKGKTGKQGNITEGKKLQ